MYITDLDNTLLDRRGLLSKRTKELLVEAMPYIDITFATARSLFTAGVVHDFVDFRLPFIVLNGAGIVDPHSMQYIKTYPISYNVFQKVIELAIGLDPFVVGVHNNKEILLHKVPKLDIHKEHLESRLRYNDKRQILIDEFKEIDAFLNLTFIDVEEKILSLKGILDEVEGIVTYFHPKTKKGTDYCTLDVMSSESSKGNAVKYLCEYLDIDLKDTISFGDDVNDLSMFEVTAKAVKTEHSNLTIDIPIIYGEDSVMEYILKDAFLLKEVFEMQDIDELINESFKEFNFVLRLKDDFYSGMNRFDREGECLYMVFLGKKVIGTCGLNIDPYLKKADIGRVRHMYVLKKFRRLGVASMLLSKIIERGKIGFNLVTLRTFSEEASNLYLKYGFIKTKRIDFATHVLGGEK